MSEKEKVTKLFGKIERNVVSLHRIIIIASMVGTLNVSDVYMDMLGTLPGEDKLDLISKLVKSMKKAVTPKVETKDIFACFSTDWGGDMSTEDYADMLRSENIESTRTVETW